MGEALLTNWHNWIWSAGVLAAAIVLALLVHRILFFILRRLSQRKGNVFLSSLVRHGQRPSAFVLPLLALLPALPAAALPEKALEPLERAVGIGVIAVTAWLVILSMDVIADLIGARYRVDAKDNLAARRLQTTMQVLHHIVVSVVVIVSLAVMLMTFPSVRHIGMSLLASAGLAGLVVGVAMKSTLTSLIAGVQIALSQPIRLEDAVVVEGEWGWIEEIATTFVVVRIWDLRRMVLPLSYFIEHPFQNWTRADTNLLGTVLLYVDYTIPVQEVREELQRILNSTDKWKGGVCVLQVTDVTQSTMQLRALMDARDADAMWDLRCLVREKLIQFLQEKYPHALPKVRAELQELPVEETRRFLAANQAGK